MKNLVMLAALAALLAGCSEHARKASYPDGWSYDREARRNAFNRQQLKNSN